MHESRTLQCYPVLEVRQFLLDPQARGLRAARSHGRSYAAEWVTSPRRPKHAEGKSSARPARAGADGDWIAGRADVTVGVLPTRCSTSHTRWRPSTHGANGAPPLDVDVRR